MSQIRLYLDEDSMRRFLVFGLRSRNVDLLTAAEAGMINRRDEEQLETAAASGRAILTHNTSDCCALHQRWMSLERVHAGIVVAPQQRYTVGEELRRIMAADQPLDRAEEMKTRLEFLASWA